MTNEDWKKLQDWWGTDLYSSFNLKVDGYNVSLQNHLHKMKVQVAVYVDNYFKGEYLNMENPIGQKFYPTKTRKLYSAKRMREMIKIWGKRKALKMQESYSYKGCYWVSFVAFKKHLKGNCTSIEIKNNAD